MERNLKNIQQRWLDFLVFMNTSEKNRNLVFEFFLVEFTKNPENFYDFIHFLYRYLKKHISQTAKQKIASEYIDIISPLCQRFGFYEEKKILDDLCFKIIKPQEYVRINRILLRYKKKSEELILKINRKLSKPLKKHNLKFEISGRYKSTSSVYQKLKSRQKNTIQGLGDIFAFRIIIKNDSKETCFEALNLLHDEFYPIAKRFKDYITIPKINGYQSLHTGLVHVIKNLDLPIEVQIRTKIMDDFAERGIAAHWFYSRNKRAKILREKEKKLIQHFYSFSQEKDIYFFSFDGDLYKMNQGSTILDFAYKIHSDFGNKLLSARVNGEKQKISYLIREGDKVKLLFAKSKQVCSDWLQFTHDKNTRKKILYATRNI